MRSSGRLAGCFEDVEGMDSNKRRREANAFMAVTGGGCKEAHIFGTNGLALAALVYASGGGKGVVAEIEENSRREDRESMG